MGAFANSMSDAAIFAVLLGAVPLAGLIAALLARATKDGPEDAAPTTSSDDNTSV